MTRVLRVGIPLFVGLLFLWSSPVRSQAGRQARERFEGRDVAAGEVLVRFSAQGLARLSAVRSLLDVEEDQPIGSQGWRRIRSSSRGVQALIQLLRLRGDVLDVEPNYLVRAVETPNDPSFDLLWGLRNLTTPGADIHAGAAWDLTTGSTSAVVGVVDSGIDSTHPDLAPNMWSAPTAFTIMLGGQPLTCPAGTHGFDALAYRAWVNSGRPSSGPLKNAVCAPGDDNGHGTHVAGTIGAVGNNGVGVTGVAWTTRLMTLKFLDAQAEGNTADGINALDFAIAVKNYFAASNGADVRVLSNSYGGGDGGFPFSDAVARTATANMLFVAAAGNANNNNDISGFYPASYTTPNIVAVASTDVNDQKSEFSSYGVTSVDLGAPGSAIYSTLPGGAYGTKYGTSMATPHVSGAAALLLSACSLTTEQLKSALLNNVDQIPALSGITATGGRLNVDRAIRSCATVPAISLTSPATGALYTEPASISIEASASDPEGISRVEFYAGTELLGTSTTSPYGLSWTNVPAGQYQLMARAYDGFGVRGTSSRTFIAVSSPGGGVPRVNVASASNGGSASASSTHGAGFSPSTLVNGERTGAVWGSGGGWNDATPNAFPDWITVEFAAQAAIDEIGVITLQDNFANPVPPTPTLTFTSYGVRDFDVQYWTDGTWQTVPGGHIVGNDLVWRRVAFPAVVTDRIRIWITNAPVSSRLVEVEALGIYGGTVNAPPSVTLTSPAAGATYTAPASVPFAADAIDTNGIDRVEFYAGASLIATLNSAPYSGSWTNVPTGTYQIKARAYDTLGAWAETPQLSVTVESGAPRINVAAASNGSVASASSTYSAGFPAAAVNNGDRTGATWGAGGGWNDATGDVFPDWVELHFNAVATIDEVSVFTLQDNWSNPAPPTPAMTFTQFGVRDFDIQYWASGSWQTVAGGHIVGNNLVWRRVAFPAVTTDRIRVWITNAPGSSRLAEVEAFGTFGGTVNVPPTVSLTTPTAGATFTAPASIPLSVSVSDADGIDRVEYYAGAALVTANSAPYSASWTNVPAGTYMVKARAYDTLGAWSETGAIEVRVNDAGGGPRLNLAAASNGGVASASSIYSSAFPAAAINNSDRAGTGWGSGGGWNDGTANLFPDWVEVQFTGVATIDEVSVFTLQDNWSSPSAPTPAMTFSQFGVRDFDIQYWVNGSWQTVPGGHVTANDLVWRRVVFAAVATDRIRVSITNAPGSSRLVEVEAMGSLGGSVNPPPTVSITSPSQGGTFISPAGIPLAVNVSDADGISHVEYYAGTTLVATTSASPYSTTWEGVGEGDYAITARAYDTLGNSADSLPVHVTVTPAGGPRINVALAANGGIASASSTYSNGFAVSSVINGDRTGAGWGNGGGWNDATSNAYPDWVEVAFNGTKTVTEVDVFTLQDSFTSPVAPTPALTFSNFGVREFEVQYWDGAAWVPVAGGHIVNNSLVWRSVTFAEVTTSKVRVLILNAPTHSRLVELEVY